MRSILLILFILYYHLGFGQNPAMARLNKRMDDGVALMEQGKYQEADAEFLYVLKNVEAVPSDLAYYFGRNSFHLEKHKQSINWLNKYIQLKGTSGRFYEQAVGYLQQAEAAYLEQARAEASKITTELSSGDYDCGGLSKMLCPVCKGQGVVIKEGAFEKIYKTCPYSAGEPYLSCEEYNQFMRGELDPKIEN